jgi:hypothetical protein
MRNQETCQKSQTNALLKMANLELDTIGQRLEQQMLSKMRLQCYSRPRYLETTISNERHFNLYPYQ